MTQQEKRNEEILEGCYSADPFDGPGVEKLSATKVLEALNVKDSFYIDKLEKVREALLQVKHDYKSDDGWITVQTIARCADAFDTLQELMEGRG